MDVRTAKITCPKIILQRRSHGIVSLVMDSRPKLPIAGTNVGKSVLALPHTTNKTCDKLTVTCGPVSLALLVFIILLPASKQLGPVTASFPREVLTAHHIIMGFAGQRVSVNIFIHLHIVIKQWPV